MAHLFLKIWIRFWVAMVMVGVLFFLLGQLYEPFSPSPFPPHMDRDPACANIAVKEYELSGPSALIGYCKDLENKSNIRLFLLDSKGNELTGKSIHLRLRELAFRRVPMGGRNAAFWETQLVQGENAEYMAVIDRNFPDPHGRKPHRGGPREGRILMALHVLTLLIASLVACYWLTSHIVKPVRKLRLATKMMADGKLDVRVAPPGNPEKDELSALGRDFDSMAERISSLVSSQRSLIQDMSHELRSPLTRLNVALELARLRTDEKAHDALDIIKREADRLNNMIGQLLMLSKLETNVLLANAMPVDLGSLVQEIAVDAEFEAQNRNCSVKVLQEGPMVVNGFRNLLHSAIENVVRNALRHTKEGTQIEICLAYAQKSGANWAVIRVRDFGCGVPEEAIGKLFQPFFKISDSAPSSGSAGLGLSIAVRVVHIHGGDISARNIPEGFVVEVTLPAQCTGARTM